MYSILSQSGNSTTYVTQFFVDREDDIAALPKYPKVAKGSTCLCLATKQVWILNNDSEWEVFA